MTFSPSQRIYRNEPPSYGGGTVLTVRLNSIEIAYDEGGSGWWSPDALLLADPSQPQPDWGTFAVNLIFDAEIQAWFNGLPQAITSGLNAGLQLASEGKPDLFLKLWDRLAAQIPSEVVAAVAALAQECNLPSEFVAALNGASSS